MYPAMSKTDDATQLFAQIMGGYKPGQLGGGVPQQEIKPVEAAQMPVDGDLSSKGGSEYIDNSGGLGVIAQAFDAYVQRKNKESGGQQKGILAEAIDRMKAK